MTRPLPGIRAEHAAAIRLVNARFAALAPAVQDSIVIGYDGLDAELDAALLSGDRPRALAAIGAWKLHWITTFEEASR